MIPVLKKKSETPEEYQAERDKAASDIIAARMEERLHGRTKNPDADSSYDPLKYGLR